MLAEKGKDLSFDDLFCLKVCTLQLFLFQTHRKIFCNALQFLAQGLADGLKSRTNQVQALVVGRCHSLLYHTSKCQKVVSIDATVLNKSD